MQCKYCHQKIPMTNTQIHICPFCNSILNEQLSQSIVIDVDNKERTVTEYARNDEMVEHHGRERYNAFKDQRQKEERQYKLRVGILIWNTILFVLSTIAFIYWKLPIMALLTTIIAIVSVRGAYKERACFFDITKLYELNPYKTATSIIKFYGNEHVFGYMHASHATNTKEEFPVVAKTEIEKKYIRGFSKNNSCYIIDYEDEEDVDWFYIPAVFTQEELTEILGLKIEQ